MKLNAAARKAIPDDQFALPGRRFPIEDKSHARAAKAMDTHLPPAEKAVVDAKADAKLGPQPRRRGILRSGM